jgi:hypothetical protein
MKRKSHSGARSAVKQHPTSSRYGKQVVSIAVNAERLSRIAANTAKIETFKIPYRVPDRSLFRECNCCHKRKKLDEFYRNHGLPMRQCIECRKTYQRKRTRAKAKRKRCPNGITVPFYLMP